MTKVIGTIAIFAAILFGSHAYGAPQDCTSALIPSSTITNSDVTTNLSLAWQLSDLSYAEASKNLSAKGTVYGVPVGGDYGQYRKNIQAKFQALDMQNFEHRSYAYATTALSGESLEAYKACLLSLGDTLGLFATRRGSSSYEIRVTFWAKKFDPELKGRLISSKNLQDAEKNVEKTIASSKFGTEQVDQQLTITPLDPAQETIIQVGVGASQSRVLTLPPIINFAPIAQCEEQLGDHCLRCGFDIDKKNVGGSPPQGEDVFPYICAKMPKNALISSKLDVKMVLPSNSNCWFNVYLNGVDGKQAITVANVNECNLEIRASTEPVPSKNKDFAQATLRIARCHGIPAGTGRNCQINGRIYIYALGAEPH